MGRSLTSFAAAQPEVSNVKHNFRGEHVHYPINREIDRSSSSFDPRNLIALDELHVVYLKDRLARSPVAVSAVRNKLRRRLGLKKSYMSGDREKGIVSTFLNDGDGFVTGWRGRPARRVPEPRDLVRRPDVTPGPEIRTHEEQIGLSGLDDKPIQPTIEHRKEIAGKRGIGAASGRPISEPLVHRQRIERRTERKDDSIYAGDAAKAFDAGNFDSFVRNSIYAGRPDAEIIDMVLSNKDMYKRVALAMGPYANLSHADLVAVVGHRIREAIQEQIDNRKPKTE